MTRLLGPIAAFALLAAGAAAHAQTAQQTPNAQRVQRPPLVVQQARPQVTQVQPRMVQPPPAAQPTPQLTTAVTVAANAGWVSTGVKAQAGGQLVVLVRDGRWSVLGKTAGVAANVGAAVFGADGIPNTAGPGALLPSANRGALIGRIGDGAPFLIGQSYTGFADADGELSVSINDAPNGFRDNQGALYIAVRATAPPPPTRTPDKPPTRDPVPGAQTPPDTPPQDTPQDTKPQDTRPAPPEEPLPPTQDAVTPPEDAPPVEALPAPETPLPPVEDVEPVTPAIPVVPLAIGAAVLAGVLLLGSLFRPRRKSGGDDKHGGAAAKVSARVASDGVSGQTLSIRKLKP